MAEEVTRKRFLWAIPIFQSVYPRPFCNFLAMALNAATKVSDRYELCPVIFEREMLHAAMNRAAQTTLLHNFDGMIVSDDDCFPPFDAIPRLLKHYEDGVEVVAGLGFMRGFPHTTTIGRYYPEGITLKVDPGTGQPIVSGFEWVEDFSEEPDGLIKADFCGYPIGMISASALLKITQPWFGTEINGGGCTHDVYFGQKAKDAGIQIYVDRNISCGHLLDAHIITEPNRAIVRNVEARWKASLKEEIERQKAAV